MSEHESRSVQRRKAAQRGEPAPGAAAQFEIYADSGGWYRWRLVSNGGAIIARSGEPFATKAAAREAAEAVKASATGAEIEAD